MALFNLVPVDSPIPETLILLLLQGLRFPNFQSGRYTWGFYLLYWSLGAWWLGRVAQDAPQPYLDEVFHIPQAQAYCESKFGVWDDKITTPPGLYLLAALYHRVLRDSICSVYSLRRMNLLGVALIHLVASSCRQHIEASYKRSRSSMTPLKGSSYAYHTAVNVALFPVLFFFSALFYTDVYSALFVLLAYQNHLRRLSDGRGIVGDIWTVCLSVSTLLMRQTNVFWVVVYMGGLEAVHVVRSLKPPAVETPAFTTLADMTKFYAWRYSVGDVHDPPLNVSSPDDWLFCGLSIAVAAVSNPARILRQIWPYISVAAIFAGFVAWNGGVVLGDKSNHVATIHLAQMLYIWPLFAFFSAPLLIPAAMSTAATVYKTVAHVLTSQKKADDQTPVPRSASLEIADFLISTAFYPCFLLGAALLSAAIVKYNTIIHPFTLADNRHYMFYVFRYTILRSPTVRFALVPVYMASAYLVWTRLAGRPPTQNSLPPSFQYIVRPFDSKTLVTRPLLLPPEANSSGKKTTSALVTNPEITAPEAASPPTSTALIWLATTALSLISAPLVEPRYFILPWVFWRLLVPAWGVAPAVELRAWRLRSLQKILWRQLRNALGSARTVVSLETAWFVVINVATFWVFLTKPYQWKDVDGKGMDGGRWQRFMW